MTDKKYTAEQWLKIMSDMNYDIYAKPEPKKSNFYDFIIVLTMFGMVVVSFYIFTALMIASM